MWTLHFVARLFSLWKLKFHVHMKYDIWTILSVVFLELPVNRWMQFASFSICYFLATFDIFFTGRHVIVLVFCLLCLREFSTCDWNAVLSRGRRLKQFRRSKLIWVGLTSNSIQLIEVRRLNRARWHKSFLYCVTDRALQEMYRKHSPAARVSCISSNCARRVLSV